MPDSDETFMLGKGTDGTDAAADSDGVLLGVEVNDAVGDTRSEALVVAETVGIAVSVALMLGEPELVGVGLSVGLVVPDSVGVGVSDTDSGG
jgi:hypothetical protein